MAGVSYAPLSSAPLVYFKYITVNSSLKACSEFAVQKNMKVSCLCLSDDHTSFYVGYTFSGIVEKYSVSTGTLVCSALAHYGDVHTLTVVQPDVLCTSGSDGQVRLLEMKSTNSVKETSSFKPNASLSQDELAYNEMCNGVLNIRLVRPTDTMSQLSMIVCSSGAPQLIVLHDSLSVQSLGTAATANIGKSFTVLSLFISVILF